MHTILTQLNNGLKRIETFLTIISGILVFLTMFLIVLNIFLRTLFDKPIVGVYEIVSLVFAAIVSFCFAYVQGEKENISVDVAIAKLSTKVKKILEIIGVFIGIISIGIIAWFGTEQAISSFNVHEYQANSLLKLPLWPVKSVVAFGMSLLFIRLCLDIFLILFNIDQKTEQDQQDKIEHI